jgi:hypothetical protein
MRPQPFACDRRRCGARYGMEEGAGSHVEAELVAHRQVDCL